MLIIQTGKSVVCGGGLVLIKMADGAALLASLALLFFCGGCETQTASQSALPNQPVVNTPVTLSPGDVIKLTFPGSTELNQSQKIQSDGKVSLPLVGQITAAGKTVPGLQTELAGLY